MISSPFRHAAPLFADVDAAPSPSSSEEAWKAYSRERQIARANNNVMMAYEARRHAARRILPEWHCDEH